MNGDLVSSNELPGVLWREARRRRVALVALFAGVAVLGLLTALLWPRKYAAATTILVQESNIIKPLMEGRAVTTGNADRAAIAREVIFSREIMGQILKTGGWLKDNPSALEQERIIERIKNRTTLSNLRENLIRIEYSDGDAERAYLVTRELATLFIQQSLAAKERESREAYQFISHQVDDYRKKLTDAEDRLKAFRGSNPDARPGSEVDTNTRIAGLRTQIENARMDATEQRSKEHALQQQISGETAITAVQTREMQYRSRLSDLQGELDKLLLTYTDRHPDVIRVRHQMRDLEDEMHTAELRASQAPAHAGPADGSIVLNPLNQELRKRLDDVRSDAAAAQSRMSISESLLQSELDRSRRIADTANTLSELTRDYEVNRDIYQDLLKRRENARVSMNLDAEHRGLTFNIQEPASLPLRPLGLRFLHFSLAGLGMGIMLPLALLFMIVRWDPRVRSSGHLEQLTGLPILASVPTMTNAADRRRGRLTNVSLGVVLAAVAAAYIVAFILKWISMS
jgi:polysaccharide chain length determinant protein (PEP-CTERM system associated)